MIWLLFCSASGRARPTWCESVSLLDVGLVKIPFSTNFGKSLFQPKSRAVDAAIWAAKTTSLGQCFSTESFQTCPSPWDPYGNLRNSMFLWAIFRFKMFHIWWKFRTKYGKLFLKNGKLWNSSCNDQIKHFKVYQCRSIDHLNNNKRYHFVPIPSEPGILVFGIFSFLWKILIFHVFLFFHIFWKKNGKL